MRTRKKRGGNKKLTKEAEEEAEKLRIEKEKDIDKQVKTDIFQNIMKNIPFPYNTAANPLTGMAVKARNNYRLVMKLIRSYNLKKQKFKKQYIQILANPESKLEFEYACKLIKRYYDPDIGKQFQILRTSKDIHNSCSEFRVLEKQYSLLNSAKETNQHIDETDILKIFNIIEPEPELEQNGEPVNNDVKGGATENTGTNNPKNKFELLYKELKKKYQSTNKNQTNVSEIVNPSSAIANPIGSIANGVKGLFGGAALLEAFGTSIMPTSENANTDKKLTKEEEDYNHKMIEYFFRIDNDKKNCSYLIPYIMIDIVSRSEFIYGKEENNGNETNDNTASGNTENVNKGNENTANNKPIDEDDIKNIKYIGLNEDCDTVYTFTDLLKVTGLSKPIESAMSLPTGGLDNLIKENIEKMKSVKGAAGLGGGYPKRGYSKRLFPKKRRLTRRRVKVIK
jgi:hypothetical protein